MRFKPTRTDRLSQEERAIVERFERGLIDAAEAGRLLIDSVTSVRAEAPASGGGHGPETDDIDPVDLDEMPEDAKARALVERIARDVYDDPT